MSKKEIRQDIENKIEDFLRTQRLNLQGVLEKAAELGLSGDVKRHLRALDPQAAEQLLIEGHPRGETLSGAYRESARLAMQSILAHPLIA
jgi:hypothetical protein